MFLNLNICDILFFNYKVKFQDVEFAPNVYDIYVYMSKYKILSKEK